MSGSLRYSLWYTIIWMELSITLRETAMAPDESASRRRASDVRGGQLTVSVVLATFNGERFIAEQLESISAQTLSPHELLVSDDGSSDQTLSIVTGFAKRATFPVTICHRGPHVGWAENFVRTLAKSTAEAVALCDQDDVWRSDKLELQASIMAADPKIALVSHSWRELRGGCLSEIIYGALAKRGRFARGDAGSLPANGAPGMTLLLRSDVVQELVRLWPHDANYAAEQRHGYWILPHDRFAIDIAVGIGDILSLRAPLVTYRAHEHNAYNRPELRTGTFNWRRRHPALKTWAKTANRFAEWGRIYRKIANANCSDPMAKVLAARASIYEHRGLAYEARYNIYTKPLMRERLVAFLHLVSGGYAALDKSILGALGTSIRDLSSMLGWR